MRYLLPLLLASCTSIVPPLPPDPVDQRYDDSAASRCPDQCERLHTVCPGSYREDCSLRCKTLVHQRLWSSGDIGCVLGASDVESMRRCRVRCAQ